MLRSSTYSAVQAKMEEISLRDTNGHAPSSPKPLRRPWLPRRSARSARRWLGFLFLVALFLLIWQELDPSDGGTSLKRYADRARNRAALLQGKPKARLHVAWPGWDGINNIFAFGDSHSETGFDPDGPQPDHKNPIGNPDWPGHTSNFGPNYLSFLTGYYNESFISLYNFARGGLPGQTRMFDSGKGDRIPVRNQIDDLFLPRYGRSAGPGKLDARTGWHQDDSLFIFYDYVDELLEQYMLRSGGPRNATRLVNDMLTYEDNIKRAYDLGARNFLIIGVPALEESFAVRNCGFKRALTTFGAEGVEANGRLAFLAQRFALKHPDATVFYYDLHRVSIRTRSDPAYYPETAGIKRKEGYCYFYADKKEVVEDDDACGNKLVEFYWRDETHHTEPFHRLMARQATDLMKDLDKALPLDVP